LPGLSLLHAFDEEETSLLHQCTAVSLQIELFLLLIAVDFSACARSLQTRLLLQLGCPGCPAKGVRDVRLGVFRMSGSSEIASSSVFSLLSRFFSFFFRLLSSSRRGLS